MSVALRAPAAFTAATNQGHRAQQSRQRRAVVVLAASSGAPGGGEAPAAPQLSRRHLQAAALAAVLTAQPLSAQALGFTKTKKKKIPVEDYLELPGEPRLRYYDLTVGNKGFEVKEGTRVKVHFDCKYRGINVVSTYTARTLGGNRTIAEPFEFIVGQPVAGPGANLYRESAGGLFAGGGGPKPPLGLTTAVVGMRVGGSRSILVPAELGFGSVGEQEIPPNCDMFELQVEMLSIIT